VLQNIRVIAIDQKTDTKAGETVVAHTATLEVTPKQAEMIALTSELGKLSLVLRSLSGADEPAITASGERPAVEAVANGNPESHTYDSEVVRVLPKFGPNGDGTTTILRGNQKQG
jgi:pilus assembly protein CpaB